jgi:thiamine kinase-like enzyme
MILSEAHRVILRAAFGNTEFAVARLSGGLHGRCIRATAKGFDYAVRMPSPDEGRFRLNSLDEQRVLARASAAGLAPPVVSTPPELGLVVTEFLTSARPWSAADARQPGNIDRLAAQLRSLHAQELELEPFAGVAAAADYARAAAERLALSPEQRRWRDDLLRLSHGLEARLTPAVPCHNDLVASNVLDDGALWLVDFEYAALSAPILDLAGVAGLNELDAGACARLVTAYYNGARAPFDADELDSAIRFVRLLAYFWALAYGTGSTAAADFAAAMAAMLR